MVKELTNQLLELMRDVPPRNNEAEQATLGAAISDVTAIGKIYNILVPSDFYLDTHAKIYGAMLYLYNRQIPVDILSLGNKLQEDGLIEKVGGYSYLTELATLTPIATHVIHYAKIIKQKSLLRKIIRLGKEIQWKGAKDDDSLDKIIDDLKSDIETLSVEKSNTLSGVSELDRPQAYKDAVIKLMKTGINKNKIPTFFKPVDEILDGGLQGGELVILSGPTKNGKSTMAQTWSYLQSRQGFSTLWFTLEMSWQELTKKFFDMDLDGQVSGEPTDIPLYYPLDNKNLSLEWLRQQIKEAKEKHSLSAVYIDHLHFLLPLKDFNTNVSFLIGGIVREIKKIAVEFDIPIILIAHTKKLDVDVNPDINAVRDSSFVVQESDFTFIIWRERIKQANGKFNVQTETNTEIYTNMGTLALEANRRNGITKKIKIGMVAGRFYPEEEYNQVNIESHMHDKDDELKKISEESPAI
jgi:replicative DNA helicase